MRKMVKKRDMIKECGVENCTGGMECYEDNGLTKLCWDCLCSKCTRGKCTPALVNIRRTPFHIKDWKQRKEESVHEIRVLMAKIEEAMKTDKETK